MNESSLKRRIWIRNAVIIFLAVLLLLTFFSQTILNHSLPEVSVQYPSWGTISSKVTATGSVRANQSYDVTVEQTRTVASVEVRVGQTVQKGDVLITFTDGVSAELEEARRALEDLKIQLIQKQKTDPSRAVEETVRTLENRIAEAKDSLTSLNRKLSALQEQKGSLPTFVELQAAKAAVLREKEMIEYYEDEVNRLTGKRGQTGGDGYYTEEELAYLIAEANDAVGEAEYLLTDAMVAMNNAKQVAEQHASLLTEAEKAYQSAQKAASEYESAMPGTAVTYSTVLQKQAAATEAQMRYLTALRSYGTTEKELQELKGAWDAASMEYQNAAAAYNSSMLKILKDQVSAAERNVTLLTAAKEEADKDYTAAKEACDKAKADRDAAAEKLSRLNGYRDYEDLTAQIKAAAEQKAAAEERLAEAEATIAAAEGDSEATLLDEIADAQRQITETKQQISSAEQEIADTRADAELDQQQYEIELTRMEASVQKQQEIVDRMAETEIGGSVVSPVSGVIESLPYSVGQEIKANTAAARITLTDAGYTMEVTVSAQQASRIKVGDTAAIQWYYWGETPTARVVSIKSDGAMSQTRTVTLEITGQVEGGTSLTVSLGGQDQSYDCVIPSAAVREDQNGTFVLVVTAKSTPLGNRYTARRVDVEVIASDETKSAVTGDVSGQYVITASAVPIASGDAVRLSEEN